MLSKYVRYFQMYFFNVVYNAINVKYQIIKFEKKVIISAFFNIILSYETNYKHFTFVFFVVVESVEYEKLSVTR